MDKNVYSQQNIYRNDDVYRDNNPYNQRNVYRQDNVYKKDNVYKRNDVYARQNGTIKQEKNEKYTRFNDLKLINEQIISLSNNTLADDAPIEVISQGMRGEIKNLLSTRILKISFIPSIFILLIAINLIVLDKFLITFILLILYVIILVRFMFFPAKLFYENIKYTTNKYALQFYEEVDYWFKISSINTILFLFASSLIVFVGSFFEDSLVKFLLENLHISNNTILNSTAQTEFVKNIHFSISMKLLALVPILTIIAYFFFINKEKRINELEKKKRIMNINKEIKTRAEQIIESKYEL